MPRNKPILSTIIGALFLLTPAFLNRYPFLYADTGTYVLAGFDDYYSYMRPMLYGLFVRHASLMESFWFVVYIQSIMVSYMIHLFFRRLGGVDNPVYPLLTIVALSLFTNIGIATGMLMPDFLAPVMILSSALLLFAHTLTALETVICVVFLFFAVAAHHSHPHILLMSLLGYGALQLAKFRSRKRMFNSWRPYLSVLLVWWIGYASVPAIHWAVAGKFERENGAHVFLLSRINQHGLLKPFLEKHCGEKGYNLCPYKDNLTENFLWDAESPVNKTGGWEANREAYNAFIKDFFSDGAFLKKFLLKSVESSIAQFFNFEGQIVYREKDDGAAVPPIRENMPDQIHAIHTALQAYNLWGHPEMDVLYRLFVFGSLAGLLFYFFFTTCPVSNAVFKNLAVWLLLALYSNAFICGGISMIDPRFQSRVVWLIPLYFMFIWMYRRNWVLPKWIEP